MVFPLSDASLEVTDEFYERTRRLANYITRSRKANKGAILLAVWRHISVLRLAENHLQQLLEEEGCTVKKVDVGDVPSGELVSHLVEITTSPEDVLFVYDLEKAGDEGVLSLNYQRETFIERPLRTVFWLRESEMNSITQRAPDFWAFRHRVVDFPETPYEPSFDIAKNQAYGDVSFDSLEEAKEKLKLRENLLKELPEDAYSARMDLLVETSGLYARISDYPQAESLTEQLMEIAEKIDDQKLLTVLYERLGLLVTFQGRVEEAERLHKRSLEIRERLEDQPGIASVVSNLGDLAMRQGRMDEASRLYNRVLEIEERLGDQPGIASALSDLGNLAKGQGNMEEADKLYKRSLEIRERLEDQSGIAFALSNLGNLAMRQGRMDEASGLYNRVLEIEERLGGQPGIANSLHQSGMIARNQGRIEEAEELYRRSLEIEERLGSQSGIAISLHMLGRLAEIQDDIQQARELYARALEIFEELKSPNADIARESLERLESQSS